MKAKIFSMLRLLLILIPMLLSTPVLSAGIEIDKLPKINQIALHAGDGYRYFAATDGDLVTYIKSLWTERELDCQGPKHMQCMN